MRDSTNKSSDPVVDFGATVQFGLWRRFVTNGRRDGIVVVVLVVMMMMSSSTSGVRQRLVSVCKGETQ